MKKIEVQELNVDGYLTLDVFKEFGDFNFEESDFDYFPEALENAKEFWDIKNDRKTSYMPYKKYLKAPADYAAVIFMKNSPDYETNNSLSDKKNNIINEAKIFVEILTARGCYLEELFNIQKEQINTSKKVTKTIS